MNGAIDKVRLVTIHALPVAMLITMLVLAKPMTAAEVRIVLVWTFLLGGLQGSMAAWSIIGRRLRKSKNAGPLME